MSNKPGSGSSYLSECCLKLPYGILQACAALQASRSPHPKDLTPAAPQIWTSSQTRWALGRSKSSICLATGGGDKPPSGGGPPGKPPGGPDDASDDEEHDPDDDEVVHLEEARLPSARKNFRIVMGPLYIQ